MSASAQEYSPVITTLDQLANQVPPLRPDDEHLLQKTFWDLQNSSRDLEPREFEKAGLIVEKILSHPDYTPETLGHVVSLVQFLRSEHLINVQKMNSIMTKPEFFNKLSPNGIESLVRALRSTYYSNHEAALALIQITESRSQSFREADHVAAETAITTTGTLHFSEGFPSPLLERIHAMLDSNLAKSRPRFRNAVLSCLVRIDPKGVESRVQSFRMDPARTFDVPHILSALLDSEESKYRAKAFEMMEQGAYPSGEAQENLMFNRTELVNEFLQRRRPRPTDATTIKIIGMFRDHRTASQFLTDQVKNVQLQPESLRALAAFVLGTNGDTRALDQLYDYVRTGLHPPQLLAAVAFALNMKDGNSERTLEILKRAAPWINLNESPDYWLYRQLQEFYQDPQLSHFCPDEESSDRLHALMKQVVEEKRTEMDAIEAQVRADAARRAGPCELNKAPPLSLAELGNKIILRLLHRQLREQDSHQEFFQQLLDAIDAVRPETLGVDELISIYENRGLEEEAYLHVKERQEILRNYSAGRIELRTRLNLIRDDAQKALRKELSWTEFWANRKKSRDLLALRRSLDYVPAEVPFVRANGEIVFQMILSPPQ